MKVNSQLVLCAFSFVLGLCLVISPVSAAMEPVAAPATLPADQTDQNTQQMLDELASGKAKAMAPTTAPAERRAELDENQQISWGRLLWIFAPMLSIASALGISAGMVGYFVLLRREALVALAIPQVVAVGAALGMRMEWPTLPPALGTALIALVYFALARRWAAGNWIVPSFYVAGLCLSFLIIANHGQDVEDLQHLFVGVDVAVSPTQAYIAVPILLVVCGVCAMLWRRWLLLAQAPAAAELAGLHPARWDTLFLTLLTAIMLLGTASTGIVLVLAMLFLPAATVLPWARRIPATLIACALLALVFVAAGFYLTNRMRWPFSQSVGGVGFVALAISQLTAQFK